MKNQTFLIFLMSVLLGICTLTYGQTLTENKIDEFTNHSVKRTSWETLSEQMSFTSFFRITRIDDLTYFDLKLMINNDLVFSISENQEIMLKLDNDEFVKLPNIQFTVTCKGCGAKGFMGSEAQGINVNYKLDNDQLGKLKNNSTVKVRIYTNDGYVEGDVRKKNALKIQNALNLIE